MDLLGKEGEEAKQHVRKVSEDVENLQSHLNAVDSALQDFMDAVERQESTLTTDVKELEQFEEHEIQQERKDQGRISGVEDDVEFLKRQLLEIKRRQIDQAKKIERIADSELLDIIERVRGLINSTNKRFYDLQDSVQHLEGRVNELENDFVMEVNTRDFDFERKVDKSEFESEVEEIERELKKVRSSLSILAEDEDDSVIWKNLN